MSLPLIRAESWVQVMVYRAPPDDRARSRAIRPPVERSAPSSILTQGRGRRIQASITPNRAQFNMGATSPAADRGPPSHACCVCPGRGAASCAVDAGGAIPKGAPKARPQALGGDAIHLPGSRTCAGDKRGRRPGSCRQEPSSTLPLPFAFATGPLRSGGTAVAGPQVRPAPWPGDSRQKRGDRHRAAQTRATTAAERSSLGRDAPLGGPQAQRRTGCSTQSPPGVPFPAAAQISRVPHGSSPTEGPADYRRSSASTMTPSRVTSATPPVHS